MLEEKWHIVLLNGLQVRRSGQTIDRFRTQKTGELLAFLALNTHRLVPREEIAGIIWPDSDLEAGRASLRTALASLRQQLEPPGVMANSVVQADRVSVRLHFDVVSTDVGAFEVACRQAESASASEQRLEHDRQAVSLYSGDLLPGYYAEWVLEERARLARMYRHHLRRIVLAFQSGGQSEAALLYAHLLLTAEPYEEATRLLTMRLYAELGQQDEALRCYDEWKRLEQKEFNAAPSREAEQLAHQFQQASAHVMPLPPVGKPSNLPESFPNLQGDSVPLHEARESGDTFPQPDSPSSPLPSARLPLTLTRFFGRETEIMQVARLLSPALEEWHRSDFVPPSRLVTLTGPGGTGKTRLAIEIARRLHSQAQLPVTFIPLADLTEPRHISEALLRGLGIAPEGIGNVFEQAVAALSLRPQALILDNFEQLLSRSGSAANRESALPEANGGIDANETQTGVDVVQTLLVRVPTLLCLVTSRQCLALEGEQEYPLLPLPTPLRAGTPERLLEFASVKLFVNRAQLSRPDFQLTPRNADVVAELCAQLEGLPLSLELAAAWTSTLSPAQIRVKLTQRFELLIGRKQGGVSRHHSLRAAIEWSYTLLEPPLQRFFAGLAIFRGGWTLEAAQQVCAEPNAAELLKALRDRSLIIVEISEDAPSGASPLTQGTAETVRYGMLESLREFADTKLDEEQRNELAERHAQWCLARLKCQDFALAEQANYYAAHQWAQSQSGREELYFQLLSSLARFWRAKGGWRVGLAALQAGLEREGSAYPASYGGLYRGAAILAWLLKDLETAHRYYEQALPLFSETGDLVVVMDIHNGMGCVALERGDLAATRQHFEQALRLAEQNAHLPMIATMRGNLGYVAMQMQAWESAEEHMQECLRIHQQCNLALAWARQNLGALALAQEQWARARTYLEQSLEEYRQLGETYRIAEVLEQLAEALEQCGEPEAARHHREESQILSLQLRGA